MKRSSLIVLLVSLAGIIWLAAKSDDPSKAFSDRHDSTNYYRYLVEGLEQGHLYLNYDVDPRLFDSDSTVQHQAARLLDASLYHKHYYIYFGVVPAALLLLPYHHLTGAHLPANCAILIFVTLGFICQAVTLMAARKRYFPAVSATMEGLLLVLLAFGSVTPVLLYTAGMYELAIAASYCFVSASVWALFSATVSPKKCLRFLSLASLFAGLAVGCRPNMVIFLPFVGLYALWLSSSSPRSVSKARVAGAVVLPALITGLLLAAYNYARFDNPFEFGDHYQLAVANLAPEKFVRASFIAPNLKWYYFSFSESISLFSLS